MKIKKESIVKMILGIILGFIVGMLVIYRSFMISVNKEFAELEDK